MNYEYECRLSGDYELDDYNFYNIEEFDDEEDVICELLMYKGHNPVIMPPEKIYNLNTITIENDRTLVTHEDVEYMIWLKKCDFGMRYILKDMKMENILFPYNQDYIDYMCRIVQRGHEGFSENRDDIVRSVVCHNIIIDYDIVKTVLYSVYKAQDIPFLEMLMNYGSQIGNMYYSAILMDDLDIVIRLEKYGFPKADSFVTSSDPFVKRIISECKRFNADTILEHFGI